MTPFFNKLVEMLQPMKPGRCSLVTRLILTLAVLAATAVHASAQTGPFSLDYYDPSTLCYPECEDGYAAAPAERASLLGVHPCLSTCSDLPVFGTNTFTRQSCGSCRSPACCPDNSYWDDYQCMCVCRLDPEIARPECKALGLCFDEQLCSCRAPVPGKSC